MERLALPSPAFPALEHLSLEAGDDIILHKILLEHAVRCSHSQASYCC